MRADKKAFDLCNTICVATRKLLPVSPNLTNDFEKTMEIELLRDKRVGEFLFLYNVASANTEHSLTWEEIFIIWNGLNYSRNSAADILINVNVDPYAQAEFYDKLSTLIFDIRATPFDEKDEQLQYEQLAKRALRNKIANCGELCSVIRTYLKLSNHIELSGFFCVPCIFKDHILLIVFKSDMRIPADFFSQQFNTFAHLCKALSKYTTAMIVDPWINLTVDITEYGALLCVARTKALGKYFDGRVSFNEQDIFSCVLGGEKRLHEKHQTPEKIQKYLGIFSELTALISPSSSAPKSPLEDLDPFNVSPTIHQL